MTDDEKLAALFRDAASDAPPSGFDHAEVVAGSRRVTVRRRSALVAAAVVLVAVAGVGSVVAWPRDPGPTTSAAAPAPERAPEAVTPFSTGGADSATTPLGPGTTECADRQDPAVRALLEQVLPEVVGAPEAATTDICLPGGERGVTLEIAGDGLLTVSYLPPGEVVSLPPGDYASAPTASGGTVVVGSSAVGSGGAAPYADRLPEVLAFLAPRL